MSSKPIHEVFLRRARGVGHILRDRVFRMTGFSASEPLTVEVDQQDDGSMRIRFRRESDGHGVIEFQNVQASSVSAIHFGEETLQNPETLGSNVEVVDNRKGVAEIPVSFRDLFSKSHGKEHTDEKSAGTSVSVEVTASQSIEGVAGFEEKVSAEAHAEISQSDTETEDTTSEFEGEEGTTVPVGKRVRITETRTRADVVQDVTGHGDFTFSLQVGKHSGGKFVGGHNRGWAKWDSWQQFVDVVKREAPDNWGLAKSFKEHHAYHADLWALDPLDAEVRYVVKFTGRVMRSYVVEEF